MFWKIVIYLTALQISQVIPYGGEDSCGTSDCARAYSKLENLCYDFTGDAGDYFSIADIHQRDGFFAVREASLYVAYNACGKITGSIDNYRVGQDLEKDKVSGGSNNGPSNSLTPSSSSIPPSSSGPTSSGPTSTGPSSTSTPPPSSSSPSPSTTPTPSTPTPGVTPPPSGGSP